MRLRDGRVLADENIHPAVIGFLRGEGIDTVSAVEAGVAGRGDEAILRAATASGRIVITHDSDFGTLAVLGGVPVVGILYLRPGHIEAGFTIQSLRAVLESSLELEPSFILVVARRGDSVVMRLRRAGGLR